MKSPKPTAAQTARYADMFAALGTEVRLQILRLLLSAHPNGMVVGDTTAHATNGLFKISVAAAGTYTARLTIGGLGYACSGKFDAHGDSTITVKRSTLTTVVVTLHLDLDGSRGGRGRRRRRGVRRPSRGRRPTPGARTPR